VVVLVKHGNMEAVECPRDEIFLLARVRGAGICGVFETSKDAQDFIEKHRLARGEDDAAGANA
jgi:hypothetical protein